MLSKGGLTLAGDRKPLVGKRNDQLLPKREEELGS